MNEFVIYPLALRMKALGFNEPCFGVFGYNDTNDKFFLISELDEGYLTPKDLINSNIGDDVSAPTWQSAFAWLIPQINDEYKVSFRKEGWFIYNLEDGEFQGSEALKKLIEIVEKKQK
jgi:hypothetical protein